MSNEINPLEDATFGSLLIGRMIACNGMHDGEAQHAPIVTVELEIAGTYGLEMELSLN